MPADFPKDIASTTTSMANFDLPLRDRKDLARAAQLRNFAMVGRPFNARSALPADHDDLYSPLSRRRPDRSLSTPYYNNSLASYNLDQSSATRFADTYNCRPASYPCRAGAVYNHSPRLPFDKAARSLYRALDGVLRHIYHLENTFKEDMRAVPYADERTRAHLWTLKVEYRGWNADVDAPPDVNDRVDYFGKHAGRLLDAIEDMRHTEHPSSHDWSGEQRGDGGYQAVTMEDVRFATKKLGVSFGAVAELLEGVKVDKQRCVVLARELRSALDILKGIQQSWEVPRDGTGKFQGDTAGAADVRIPIPVSEWDGYSQT